MALWWCTNGPGWINGEGWEEAAQEEGEEELGDWWFGVGLDPAGEDGVTLVDLRRNGLQGRQGTQGVSAMQAQQPGAERSMPVRTLLLWSWGSRIRWGSLCHPR